MTQDEANNLHISTKDSLSFLGIDVNDVDEFWYDLILLDDDFNKRRHIYKNTRNTKVRQGHWYGFIEKYIPKEVFDKNHSYIKYNNYHFAEWDKDEIFLYDFLKIKSNGILRKFQESYYLATLSDYDKEHRNASSIINVKETIEYFTKHFIHVSKYNNINVFLYVMRAAWELIDLKECPISPLKIYSIVKKLSNKCLGDSKMKYMNPKHNKYYIEPGYNRTEVLKEHRALSELELNIKLTYELHPDEKYTIDEYLTKINNYLTENPDQAKSLLKKKYVYEEERIEPDRLIKEQRTVKVPVNKKAKNPRKFYEQKAIVYVPANEAESILYNEENDYYYKIVRKTVWDSYKLSKSTLERMLKKIAIYDKMIVRKEQDKTVRKKQDKTVRKKQDRSEWHSLVNLEEKSKENFEKVKKEFPELDRLNYNNYRSKLKKELKKED